MPTGHLVRLFNAPKSPFILLEATIKDKHKFLWVNLKENPPLIEDISDLFTEIPTRIAWDNSDNDNIFAFYPAKYLPDQYQRQSHLPSRCRKLA